MKKIMSAVVLVCFLLNTFISDYAFALSPQLISGNPNSPVRGEVYAAGQKLFAVKKGPGSELVKSIDKTMDGVFVGDVPKMTGITYMGAGNKQLPDGWEKNPIFNKADLVDAFKYFRDNEAKIPAETLDIKEGYFKVDEAKGELPIARIRVNKDGTYTLILHTKFVQMWNHILANDILFSVDLPMPGSPEVHESRDVSLAWAIFYRVAKHEMADLKKASGAMKGGGHLNERNVWFKGIHIDQSTEELFANRIGGRYSLINDSLWMWFLGSYCFGNATRYNQNTLEKRLRWFFGEGGEKYGLSKEFPNLYKKQSKEPNERKLDFAVKLALMANYYFFKDIPTAKVPRFTVKAEFKKEYAAREGLREEYFPATGADEQPAEEPKSEEKAIANTAANLYHEAARDPGGYRDFDRSGDIADKLIKLAGNEKAAPIIEEALRIAVTEGIFWEDRLQAIHLCDKLIQVKGREAAVIIGDILKKAVITKGALKYVPGQLCDKIVELIGKNAASILGDALKKAAKESGTRNSVEILIDKLEKLIPGKATPFLGNALKDASEHNSYIIAIEIGEIARKEDVPILADVLKKVAGLKLTGTEDWLCERICDRLIEFAGKDAAPIIREVLVKQMGDSNRLFINVLADKLADIADREDINVLAACLKNKNCYKGDVREKVAKKLEGLASKEDVLPATGADEQTADKKAYRQLITFAKDGKPEALVAYLKLRFKGLGDKAETELDTIRNVLKSERKFRPKLERFEELWAASHAVEKAPSTDIADNGKAIQPAAKPALPSYTPVAAITPGDILRILRETRDEMLPKTASAQSLTRRHLEVLNNIVSRGEDAVVGNRSRYDSAYYTPLTNIINSLIMSLGDEAAAITRDIAGGEAGDEERDLGQLKAIANRAMDKFVKLQDRYTSDITSMAGLVGTGLPKIIRKGWFGRWLVTRIDAYPAPSSFRLSIGSSWYLSSWYVSTHDKADLFAIAYDNSGKYGVTRFDFGTLFEYPLYGGVTLPGKVLLGVDLSEAQERSKTTWVIDAAAFEDLIKGMVDKGIITPEIGKTAIETGMVDVMQKVQYWYKESMTVRLVSSKYAGDEVWKITTMFRNAISSSDWSGAKAFIEKTLPLATKNDIPVIREALEIVMNNIPETRKAYGKTNYHYAEDIARSLVDRLELLAGDEIIPVIAEDIKAALGHDDNWGIVTFLADRLVSRAGDKDVADIERVIGMVGAFKNSSLPEARNVDDIIGMLEQKLSEIKKAVVDAKAKAAPSTDIADNGKTATYSPENSFKALQADLKKRLHGKGIAAFSEDNSIAWRAEDNSIVTHNIIDFNENFLRFRNEYDAREVTKKSITVEFYADKAFFVWSDDSASGAEDIGRHECTIKGPPPAYFAVNDNLELFAVVTPEFLKRYESHIEEVEKTGLHVSSLVHFISKDDKKALKGLTVLRPEDAKEHLSLKAFLREIGDTYGKGNATRLENDFKYAEIKSISQLLSKTPKWLRKIRSTHGIGKGSLEMIRAVLAKHGLVLKGDKLPKRAPSTDIADNGKAPAPFAFHVANKGSYYLITLPDGSDKRIKHHIIVKNLVAELEDAVKATGIHIATDPAGIVVTAEGIDYRKKLKIDQRFAENLMNRLNEAYAEIKKSGVTVTTKPAALMPKVEETTAATAVVGNAMGETFRGLERLLANDGYEMLKHPGMVGDSRSSAEGAFDWGRAGLISVRRQGNIAYFIGEDDDGVIRFSASIFNRPVVTVALNEKDTQVALDAQGKVYLVVKDTTLPFIMKLGDGTAVSNATLEAPDRSKQDAVIFDHIRIISTISANKLNLVSYTVSIRQESAPSTDIADNGKVPGNIAEGFFNNLRLRLPPYVSASTGKNYIQWVSHTSTSPTRNTISLESSHHLRINHYYDMYDARQKSMTVDVHAHGVTITWEDDFTSEEGRKQFTYRYTGKCPIISFAVNKENELFAVADSKFVRAYNRKVSEAEKKGIHVAPMLNFVSNRNRKMLSKLMMLDSARAPSTDIADNGGGMKFDKAEYKLMEIPGPQLFSYKGLNGKTYHIRIRANHYEYININNEIAAFSGNTEETDISKCGLAKTEMPQVCKNAIDYMMGSIAARRASDNLIGVSMISDYSVIEDSRQEKLFKIETHPGEVIVTNLNEGDERVFTESGVIAGELADVIYELVEREPLNVSLFLKSNAVEREKCVAFQTEKISKFLITMHEKLSPALAGTSTEFIYDAHTLQKGDIILRASGNGGQIDIFRELKQDTFHKYLVMTVSIGKEGNLTYPQYTMIGPFNEAAQKSNVLRLTNIRDINALNALLSEARAILAEKKQILERLSRLAPAAPEQAAPSTDIADNGKAPAAVENAVARYPFLARFPQAVSGYINAVVKAVDEINTRGSAKATLKDNGQDLIVALEGKGLRNVLVRCAPIQKGQSVQYGFRLGYEDTGAVSMYPETPAQLSNDIVKLAEASALSFVENELREAGNIVLQGEKKLSALRYYAGIDQLNEAQVIKEADLYVAYKRENNIVIVTPVKSILEMHSKSAQALVQNIVDYTAQYAPEFGPASPKAQEIVAPGAATSENIYKSVELLSSNKIEILIPSSVGMTETMKDTLSKIRQNKGEKSVVCRLFDSEEHLAEMLKTRPESGVKRVVVSDNMATKRAINNLAEADPKLFTGVRLLSVVLPEGYGELNKQFKSVYQADIITRAILVRLLEKNGNPFVRALLKSLIDERIEGDMIANADAFIDKLIESDNEAKDPQAILKRIQYCLDTAVNLIEKIGEQLVILRHFVWTAA